MSAWKQLERVVAAVLGGVRSWETDHDVLVVTDDLFARKDVLSRAPLHGDETGPELLWLAKAGAIELASIEVKNLKGPTVAQLEAFLYFNRQKADRDGVRWNALVVKRKAGVGRKTMPLLVIPLELFDGSH